MLDPAVPLSSMLALLLSFKSDNRCRRSLPKLQLQQDVADAGACLAHHFSCVCSKSYLSAAFPADVEMVLGKHLDAARNLRA